MLSPLCRAASCGKGTTPTAARDEPRTCQASHVHEPGDHVMSEDGRGRGNGGTPESLAELLEEERLVSARRHEIHQRIDELRALLGGRTGRPERPPLVGP